ncbi:hypothetical protein ACMG5R_10800 [Staphylococcus warneri]|uniref:hypothetical protein n=1 Tax=Staphylococcus warneri TaxID=1292 RepID=UPI003CE9B3DF
MSGTNVKVFEMIDFTTSDSHKDLFKEFLNFSEDILISIQKREQELSKEIKWINQHFIDLIKKISLLDENKYKKSLLKMAISDLDLLREYDDFDDDKAFDFIELVINLNNKVKYLTQKNEHAKGTFVGSEKYERFENPDLERVAG